MVRDSEPNLVGYLADCLIGDDLEPVDAFFRAHGVAAPVVLWDPSAGAMGSASQDFLVDYWKRGRGARRWPPESLIDPIDLRPALGNLLVCEPLEDLSDFRIRLYGSRLALDMGRDLTGSHVSDVDPNSHITTFYLACYRAVVLRGAPLFTRHIPSAKSYAAEIKRLLLPFGPEGGVNRVLVSVESQPRRPLGRPGWTKRS